MMRKVCFSLAAGVVWTLSAVAAEPQFFNDVKIPMRDGVNLAGDVYLPSNRTGKVRVDVAGSCAPHFAVNPDPATVTIHAGSALRLPTIP